MLRSMTAFASRERAVAGATLRWELKSVNHRYLSVNPRLPDLLRFLEPQVRERIDGAVGRGKVDATLSYDPGAGGGIAIDWGYVDEVINACDALAARQGGERAEVSPLELLRMPGVTKDACHDVEALAEAAVTLLDETLTDLVVAREREGERLAALIRERLGQLDAAVGVVRSQRETAIESIHERLRSRLAALDVQADPGRLEQELAIAAQRLDIDEELGRLSSHSAEIQASLASSEPVGRRLDFLMQELNREANTLSSKSVDTETTRQAVDMKVCIEQMREQVQNIE